MTKRLSIGVLETGRPPEELAGRYSNYPAMVAAWLAELDADFSDYAVLDGQIPSSPREHDLWVITGSKFGAYEDHPWIAPLEGFIRACRAAGQPMFGICFGHQIIAQALGGEVRKSDKGWGLGLHDYQSEGLLEDTSNQPIMTLSAFHQDQVVDIPQGAQRVAHSEFCEIAALYYPGFALTVQGHPEFREPYLRDLAKLRAGQVFSQAEAEAAEASYDRADTAADLVRVLKSLLLDKETRAAS